MTGAAKYLRGKEISQMCKHGREGTQKRVKKDGVKMRRYGRMETYHPDKLMLGDSIRWRRIAAGRKLKPRSVTLL
jgi:hypothetical protein